MTSFEVIKKLKRKLPGIKLGHLGTLDPMAEGVLPIAIGSATRVIEYIKNRSKTYKTTMVLGGISDTQDAWGNISYNQDVQPDLNRIPEILNNFTGIIEQIPPMYSAVHHNGQRLYELARKGIVVERKLRQTIINRIDLLNIDDKDQKQIKVDLLVDCGEGTYIRTLCNDIGLKLGTGAYMGALIRLRSGVFTREEAIDLEELLQMDTDSIINLIKPVDFPLQDIPDIKLTDINDIKRIKNGNFIESKVYSENIYRIYDADNQLISIAKNMMKNNKYIIKPLKVI